MRRTRTTPFRVMLAMLLAAAGGSVVLLGPAQRAEAAPIGSVVLYQCGTSVCSVDPDVAGSGKVVRTNAKPAGVTADGKTAGVVDRSTQEVREIPLVSGGFNRVMATPGSADPPDFATISGTGASTAWVWYFATIGWYAEVAPAGGTWSAPASSTMQLSVGWKGDQLVTTHRGTSAIGSRVCVEVAGGPGCDTQLAIEPDRNQQLAFPDVNASGSIVAVRGPESTGYGLPYYGSLALYANGSATGPSKILTTGQDSHPEFSAEGNRVVFERKDQGIWVINTDGTGLRKIADGSMPFWGGTRHEPPAPNVAPKGAYESAAGGTGTVKVVGWGFDPNASSTSINVHVYIGGPSGTAGAERQVITANVARPDVNTANGITGNHGFNATLTTAKRGSQQVCAYLINTPAGTNPSLGCKTVTIATPNVAPKGAYDSAAGGVGTVKVVGWGFDPNASSTSIKAHVYIGGPYGTAGAELHAITANVARPDVNTANGITGNHGFNATLTTAKRGSQQVCVYLINTPAGTNPTVGCKTVTVASPPPNVVPKGAYDSAAGGVGTVKVVGWGFDPNASSTSIKAHVYIGGPYGTAGAELHAITANVARPDVNTANGITGNHGFNATLTTAKRGSQQVCVYLINTPAGTNPTVGCKTVTIARPPALVVGKVFPVVPAATRLVLDTRCPAANRSGCRGTVDVRIGGKLAARGGYTVKAGVRTNVTIPLNSAGRYFVRRGRLLSAAIRSAGTVPVGAASSTTLRITVRR